MAKKMKRSTTEDESSSGSQSSTDDISREEAARRRRRRSQARRNTSKKQRSYSHGKEIIKFLAEVKEEMYIQLQKLREEMCKQSKQATESKEEICKQLEKVKEENQEMRKQLTEVLTDLRKKWDLHTNGSSVDDSDGPRSQLSQVQPPRYRLVLKSGVSDKIEKGQTIDISVALVDGSNDQIVENGPLASATVELVVLNAEFNQHNNQYNWSREDFESNIKKVRERNSVTGDVDQSVKSIVSNGRFNLVHGTRCHSGSTIFSNSSNKKVRLGVMVVSTMEERVLEGLSNSFFVRGHDRPARQNNLRRNRSNTQSPALVDDDYQEPDGPMPNTQNPSWPNSTQSAGTRSNITGGQPQIPIIGDVTTPGLNITRGQPQLPFLENTTMLSTSQEQQASIQQYQVPHLPMLAQAMNYQTVPDELSAALVVNVRNPNFMVCDQAIGTDGAMCRQTWAAGPPPGPKSSPKPEGPINVRDHLTSSFDISFEPFDWRRENNNAARTTRVAGVSSRAHRGAPRLWSAAVDLRR